MEIKKISPTEYEDFAKIVNQDHFLHSSEWAKARQKIRWDYDILGYYEKDNIKAAALIMYKKFPYIKKYYAYCSRGFIIDYSNQELLKKFTEELKEYLKNKKVVSLTIDPDIILNKLDDDYKVVEHYPTVDGIMDNLIKTDYIHQGFSNNFEGIQPRHTFRINIKEIPKEELLKKMHRSTRYSINLVTKSNNLEVEYKDSSSLDEFMSLMDETTKRDGFTSRNKNYYQNIMDEFKEQVKLIFISIKPQEIQQKHEEELTNINCAIINLKNGKPVEELGKKAKNKVLELQKQADKIKEKIDKLKPYLKHEKLNLATAFLLMHNKKAWYVYGASSDHLREYRPTYLIYKTMIDYCYENEMEFLDLFGVGGELNPDSEIHGLYVIKKGFGGDLVEFIGEYDLIINNFYYSVYKKVFPKLKSLRKKIKK